MDLKLRFYLMFIFFVILSVSLVSSSRWPHEGMSSLTNGQCLPSCGQYLASIGEPDYQNSGCCGSVKSSHPLNAYYGVSYDCDACVATTSQNNNPCASHSTVYNSRQCETLNNDNYGAPGGGVTTTGSTITTDYRGASITLRLGYGTSPAWDWAYYLTSCSGGTVNTYCSAYVGTPLVPLYCRQEGPVKVRSTATPASGSVLSVDTTLYNINWDLNENHCLCYGKTWLTNISLFAPGTNASCCGDDSNEFLIRSEINPSIVACCNMSTDCVMPDGSCRRNGLCEEKCWVPTNTTHIPVPYPFQYGPDEDNNMMSDYDDRDGLRGDPACRASVTNVNFIRDIYKGLILVK
jgi:hypothetical protein